MSTSSSPLTQRSEVKTNTLLLVRMTVAACLVFWIFVFADSGWGPILVPLSNKLQVSLTITGLFYVVWSTGYLPGALIGGAMLDLYGPRRVLFGASLIILCGFFTIYIGLLLPHFVPVIALLAIAGLGGIGGGVIDASTNGLISAIYTQRRGMALNMFNLLYPLGGVLVALTDAGLLRLFHNDPRPCFIFTLCFAVGAVVSLLAIPPKYKLGDKAPLPRRGGGGGDEGWGRLRRPPAGFVIHDQGRLRRPPAGFVIHDQGRLRRPPAGFVIHDQGRLRRPPAGFVIHDQGRLRRPPAGFAIHDQESSRLDEPNSPKSLVTILAPVILVMMLTSGISSSVRAWTPAYLHVAYAQAPAIAAALSSITWLLAASSRLGAAFLILRIGSWRMVMLGIVVTLLGLVAMMFSPNAVVATLAIALTSIGLSPIFATCLAIGSERAGRSFGSVAGILLFVSGISTVFCGWFFGFLLNTLGPIWPVIFCFAFVILGGLMALRLRPAH
jgi:MFS family permease